MKLLLCSQGITNESIKKKFFEMVGKKPKDIRLAYIPTAVYTVPVPDKRWMIDNLRRLDDMKIGIIDIVEISAMPKEEWLPRLEDADVIFVEGGAIGHLLSEVRKAGLDKILPVLLNDKVYVGCSGGSTMLGGVTIGSSSKAPGYSVLEGLGIIDFSIRPHFYRADRAQFTEELIQDIAKKYGTTFYAIDDDTAIALEDGCVEVVSEGKWGKFKA